MNKILVCRTDRIGDFVLSLPFLSQLKQMINSEICVLISPGLVPLLKFVDSIDSFIVYDKNYVKSFSGFVSFSNYLRQQDFDIAIALNPNLRLHFLLFLSGIPRKIGWNVKGGKWLLDDVLLYTKPKGLMHEVHYNMLFLKMFGIDDWERPVPNLVLDKEVDRIFSRLTVAVHVGASCPSKKWPITSFLQLCKRIVNNKMAIVFIGDEKVGQEVENIWPYFSEDERIWIKNFCGIPLDETVYVLAASDVLVSNDSGPVHIASALDIPSVVVFGRNDANLSPQRWKPLHPYSRVIHKADCKVCLAHKCDKGFGCLKKITVDEVFELLLDVLTYARAKEVKL